MKIVYTPGVWDLFHVGHLGFLISARNLGESLIVGVAGDTAVLYDKGKLPIILEDQRLKIIQSLKVVDYAGLYYDLDFIPHLTRFRPHVLAVGEQWGEAKRHRDAEEWANLNNCEIVKVHRTPGVSTTDICKRIRGRI